MELNQCCPLILISIAKIRNQALVSVTGSVAANLGKYFTGLNNLTNIIQICFHQPCQNATGQCTRANANFAAWV